MRVEKTKLDDVLLITPDVFKDHRGEYVEIWNRKDYNPFLNLYSGVWDGYKSIKFVQDNISVSRYNVLRGIHGDYKTWKLVSCLSGSICLVVVNNMLDTPQYHEHTQFILSDQNHHQVLIPPGFGNGHYVMSHQAIFHYKQSTYYDPESQFTLRWNDPELDIDWPLGYDPNSTSTVPSNPILSNRDRG